MYERPSVVDDYIEEIPVVINPNLARFPVAALGKLENNII